MNTAGRRKRRSPRGLRHPLLEHNYPRTKVVRAATASERPSVGHGRARSNEPARTPLGPPGQYEASTNDEPRHQPAYPETRPNQRLYVPLGSPPSVAVGLSSTRVAAHRSRAPNLGIKNAVDCGPSKAHRARCMINCAPMRHHVAHRGHYTGGAELRAYRKTGRKNERS